MRFSSRSISFVLAVLLWGPAAFAQVVPADSQALLVLRILAFDRKLPDRASDEVRIAVLFKGGNGESEQCHLDIQRALDKASKRQSVAGHNVKVVPVAHSAALAAELQRLRPSAAYVCPGLEDRTREISQATRSVGALTVSGIEQYVKDGLSVALVRRDPKVVVVVNLPSSRAEGADLDAGLLKVAEVLR